MTVRRWIVLFLGIALLCSGIIMLPCNRSEIRQIVISQDGKEIRRIDLDTVVYPYEMTVSYQGSTNRIKISSESVYVSFSDCANQICVDHGPLLPNGSPIVCLPNRLTIRWADNPLDN